jgi:hypothetical protein
MVDFVSGLMGVWTVFLGGLEGRGGAFEGLLLDAAFIGLPEDDACTLVELS